MSSRARFEDCAGSRCEVDSHVDKVEQVEMSSGTRMGLLCISAQINEMKSEANRAIPGPLPHQNLDESACESLPLECAMVLHGALVVVFRFVSHAP